jgi:hypothetical protein
VGFLDQTFGAREAQQPRNFPSIIAKALMRRFSAAAKHFVKVLLDLALRKGAGEAQAANEWPITLALPLCDGKHRDGRDPTVSTLTSGFSAIRCATTEPAEPDPQTIKSYCGFNAEVSRA